MSELTRRFLACCVVAGLLSACGATQPSTSTYSVSKPVEYGVTDQDIEDIAEDAMEDVDTSDFDALS